MLRKVVDAMEFAEFALDPGEFFGGDDQVMQGRFRGLKGCREVAGKAAAKSLIAMPGIEYGRPRFRPTEHRVIPYRGKEQDPFVRDHSFGPRMTTVRDHLFQRVLGIA